MDKFIGFDIDHKHTLACIVQAGQPDRYRKLRTHVDQLREWLQAQRGPGDRLHLTFEVSGFVGSQFAAYFGVTPRLDESGSRRRMGHISKQGSSVVRWLMVESAWRAVRHSPALRAFYERVMHGQRQRNKIAIVATARKLLTIMRAMLMTGETFNESLASEQVVLAQRSRECVA